MSRTSTDALRWVRDGTAIFLATVDHLDEQAYRQDSALPTWTRAHVVAHVAANAEALGRLVHWAATGEPTPMYASAQERTAGIENGARRPAADLRSWLTDSAHVLENALHALTPEQWQREVRTAQGRTVAATEIPWMRAREVYVHAVDLDSGVTFDDLPEDLLIALCHDVIVKRSTQHDSPSLILDPHEVEDTWELNVASEPVVRVGGPLAQIAAYLTGRSHHLAAAPPLEAWL